MKLLKGIAPAVVLLAAAALPAGAQTEAVGNWHGFLQTPVGELTLIVTVTENDEGALTAQLESPNQAPGKKIPITRIQATADHLSFSIEGISAGFEGDWVEGEQHWAGHWQQGGKAPLTLERGLPPGNAVVEGLDGTWEGTVRRNGVDLRLILRAETGARGTDVTLDSPDLGAYGLPVAAFAREANDVTFTVPASGAQFAGTLSGDEARFAGTWSMPGRPEAQVTFVRTSTAAERPKPSRPQTPEEPTEYREEKVGFANPAAAGVELAGTLTVPPGAGPFPAAILISGSGPQDRDETIFGHRPFAVLADHLTRHGVAVLRYDDRGFGESTGDHEAATSADFATDASAAARYLRTRPEIDRHGIAFLVLLAGPGTSTLQLMRSQNHLMGLSRGRSEEELARAAPVVELIFAAVAESSGPEDAHRRVDALLTPRALEALAFETVSRDLLVQAYSRNWFRYFLQYDPAAFLSRVDVPVLALNGSLDQQVPADANLAGISAALAHNRDVTVRKLDRLNHLFQTAETGALGEYADISETFAPAALDAVASWIVARFGTAGGGQAATP